MKTLLEWNRLEFKDWCKDTDLFQKYLDNRSKYPQPENSWDYWMKNKSPEELKSFIDNYKSKNQKAKEEKVAGSEVIYNDANWKVVHLLTYDAAKYYGKGSKWCICGTYPGHEGQGQNFFDSYLRSKYSGYYLFLNKHPKQIGEDEKWMVCLYKNGGNGDIWDQPNDDTVPSIPGCPEVEGFEWMLPFTIKDGVLVSVNDKAIESGIAIALPDNCREIKRRVFANKGIAGIPDLNKVEVIGTGAFMNTSVRGIRIPETVTKIGSGAFAGCSMLTAISFDSECDIPDFCCYNCGDLICVTIKGRPHIGEDAFSEVNKDLEFRVDTGYPELIEYANKNGFEVVSTSTGEILNAEDISYDDKYEEGPNSLEGGYYV